MRTSPTACRVWSSSSRPVRPKGVAPIAEVNGRLRVDDTDKTRKLVVVPDDGSEEIAYPVSKRARLRFQDGDHVSVGDKLHEGAVNPHEVLRILGPRQVQLHLVAEVQEVYRSQGVSIHDKHIEVIIRQMLKRVNVLESGATEFLPGALIERSRVRDREPSGRGRGRRAGCRPPGPDGHHQGLAGHRVVAVGGLLPGDDPRPHRRGDLRQAATRSSASRRTSSSASSSRPVPASAGTATSGSSRPRRPAPQGVLDGRLRRPRLRLRFRVGRRRAARRLRLRTARHAGAASRTTPPTPARSPRRAAAPGRESVTRPRQPGYRPPPRNRPALRATTADPHVELRPAPRCSAHRSCLPARPGAAGASWSAGRASRRSGAAGVRQVGVAAHRRRTSAAPLPLRPPATRHSPPPALG